MSVSRMLRAMERFECLRGRDRWAVGALVCVLVTLPALLLGSALDVFPLLWWGVASLYLGISWLAPGVFAGAAASEWGKKLGVKRPKALGLAVGPIVALGLLVLAATILYTFQGDRLKEESKPQVEAKPAVGDRRERVALVTQAAGGNRRYGPVVEVQCDRDREGLCVVTYLAPACQLWEVVNVDGQDRARPLGGAPIADARGVLDDGPERYGIGCR
jgi:hypothetical protein